MATEIRNSYAPMKTYGDRIKIDPESPADHIVWRAAALLQRQEEQLDPQNRQTLPPTMIRIKKVYMLDEESEQVRQFTHAQFSEYGAAVQQEILSAAHLIEAEVMTNIGGESNTYKVELAFLGDHGWFARSTNPYMYEPFISNRTGATIRNWSASYDLCALLLYVFPFFSKEAEIEREHQKERQERLAAAETEVMKGGWVIPGGQTVTVKDERKAASSLEADFEKLLAGELV